MIYRLTSVCMAWIWLLLYKLAGHTVEDGQGEVYHRFWNINEHLTIGINRYWIWEKDDSESDCTFYDIGFLTVCIWH